MSFVKLLRLLNNFLLFAQKSMIQKLNVKFLLFTVQFQLNIIYNLDQTTNQGLMDNTGILRLHLQLTTYKNKEKLSRK